MESTVRLDGLYPEWDEFLLSVCDICGIIIIPQALEKHYKTKHHIVVQTTNHNTPAVTAKAVVTTPTTTASTPTIPTTTTTTNNHQPPQVQSPQSTSSSASSSSSSSSAASSASNASSNSYSTSANLSHLIMLPTSKSSTNILPPSAFSSRYQDRKWRNTYNVLKDAFL